MFSATPGWVGSIAEGYESAPQRRRRRVGKLRGIRRIAKAWSAASKHKRIAMAFGGEKGRDGPCKNRIEEDPTPAVDENRFPSPHQRAS